MPGPGDTIGRMSTGSASGSRSGSYRAGGSLGASGASGAGPGPGFRVTVTPLHQALKTGETTTEYVLVEIRAPEEVQGPVPRLSAMLVLDTSGSMQGESIAQVKESVQRLSAILSDGDSLGVVSFSDRAQTLIPITRLGSGPGQDESRRSIVSAAQKLRADGGTNISAGLSHAALLFPSRAADERQLALLLSDGQPNVGSQTAEELAQEAKMIKSRGIAISTLGFGSSHNEDILLSIADAGGGRYGFVKDPLLAASSFARALGAQRDVVGEEVRFTLLPSSGVEITRLLGGLKTSFGADGLSVPLEDLIAGDQLNIVIELRVTAPREVGRYRLLRTALSLRPPGRSASGGQRDTLSIREELHVDLSPLGKSLSDRRVKEMVVLAHVVELREKGRALLDLRNFSAAVGILSQARDEIVALYGGVPPEDSPLRDPYETLLDDITVAEKAPDPEKYKLLRKSQLAPGTMEVTVSRATGANKQVSAEHMLAKLQVLHGGQAGPSGGKPGARLVCVDGALLGRVFDLGAECILGRGATSSIVVPDPNITRRHVLIQKRDTGYMAFDMGSSNGTQLNGRNIERAELKPGDILQVGDHRFRFEPEK